MTSISHPEIIHIEPLVEAHYGDIVEYTLPNSGYKIQGKVVHEEWRHNIPGDLDSEESSSLSEGRFSDPPAKALLRLGFFTINVGTKEEPKYIGGIPAHDAKLIKDQRMEGETPPRHRGSHGQDSLPDRAHRKSGRRTYDQCR